jgi:hypothetical protein
MDDDEIRIALRRIARPHRSGGTVVEHASILAAGGDTRAILAWIAAHDGRAESAEPAASRGGLHGGRLTFGDAPVSTDPLRFVLPADCLA